MIVLLHDCFSLIVPVNFTEDELRYLVHQAFEVNKGIKDMLDLKKTPEEFLESIEHLDIDMDDYIDEVEENLEFFALV